MLFHLVNNIFIYIFKCDGTKLMSLFRYFYAHAQCLHLYLGTVTYHVESQYSQYSAEVFETVCLSYLVTNEFSSVQVAIPATSL